MRLQILTLLCLLSLSSGSFAGEVGNGGGIAQQNIAYAYAHVENFLSVCIKNPQCNFTVLEKNIGLAIVSSIGIERNSKDNLEFVDGSQNPNFFIVNGRRVTARTGDRVGDKIYVDSSGITFSNNTGTYPMSISQAVGLLAHELGHHHSATEDELIVFGAKVQAMSAGQIQKVDYQFNFGESVYLTAINFWPDYTQKGIAQILIGDSTALIDLSNLFIVKCEEKEFPGIPKGSLYTWYTWVSNPHWLSAEENGGFHSKELNFEGVFQYQCRFKSGEGTVAGRATFNVKLLLSKPFWGTLQDYIPGSAQITMTPY